MRDTMVLRVFRSKAWGDVEHWTWHLVDGDDVVAVSAKSFSGQREMLLAFDRIFGPKNLNPDVPLIRMELETQAGEFYSEFVR